MDSTIFVDGGTGTNNTYGLYADLGSLIASYAGSTVQAVPRLRTGEVR